MCESGDVVLIPFPYSDMSAAKRRPVLVLTKPDRHGDFICLAVTSVRTRERAVPIRSMNMAAGRLPKDSWIRLDKIFTLSSTKILKRVGHLKEDAMQMALRGCCEFIGCI